MKKLLMMGWLTCTMSAAPGFADEPERESDVESPGTPASATPEWSNYNESDPGIAESEPVEPAPGRVAPSQTRVLVMPTAADTRNAPCPDAKTSIPRAAEEPGDAPRATFGDGRQSRIPQEVEDGCRQGDPDRPMIRGSVPNPEPEGD